MDKLLTKARHSLLIVSFLGVVFSLTGASFTGQSAIASYLGVKFSDTEGFKWVYLIVLLYSLFRYVIYYHNDFIRLLSDSMKRSINRPLINLVLKKVMVDVSNGKEFGYSYGFLDHEEKEASGCFVLYLTYFDGHGNSFPCYVAFNISNSRINGLCTLAILGGSGFSRDNANCVKYLKFHSEEKVFNGDFGGDGREYVYVIKEFSWVGVLVFVFGMISFIYDSLIKIDFFEYTVPLVSAIIAFIMTIEYFFFSEKTLGTLPLISNGFI
ncbi:MULTISPECIES: hypothetical protein [Pectobacterium]|uniref:hypothetical protein n=1 Tax=Pectobacterium TaxID=122277 RepID=UPI0015DF866F|nr:hypothetical protein [Pectobacterium odoriferum]MBA0188281.1 hypothetical protein [Pectobacterium odoriferum]